MNTYLKDREDSSFSGSKAEFNSDFNNYEFCNNRLLEKIMIIQLKKKSLVLIALLLVLVSFSTQAQRSVKRINFDWKFSNKLPVEAYAKEFDDSEWQSVNLPHDAGIYGPFVKDSLGAHRNNGYRPRTKGWYRKSISVESNPEKRVLLEFEGVYRDAKVYLNGKLAFRQLNGYIGFEVDATEYISSDNKLIIAVSYDNTYTESSRWYTGEGIYRDVYLKIVDQVSIVNDGVYVTTPIISEESATVRISTEIVNSSFTEKFVTLQSSIYDPDGKEVAAGTARFPMDQKHEYKAIQELKVNDPELWSLSNPCQYRIVSKLMYSDEVSDQLETRFGIRQIEFNPENGFLLNGEKIVLKGVNIHHDLGPLGAAAFEAGYARKLQGLKELGCNAIRLSHNPHDEYILEWCDENGMLVFDEAFDKWTNQFYGPPKNAHEIWSLFDENWERDLRAFIKRDRNHPSVFIWSVGNEVLRQWSVTEGSYGVNILSKLVDFVHEFEPSRKVTCGLFPTRGKNVMYWDKTGYGPAGPHVMAFHMDVMSVNYMSEFFERDRKKYPQLVFLMSEASANNGGDVWFDYDKSYTCGQFYWGGIEYIGEAGNWPSKGWQSGFIDLCDFWKPIAYYVQSFYSEKPIVKIAIKDPDEERQKKYAFEI